MRRLVVALVLVGGLALGVAGIAGSGIGVDSVTPSRVHVGETLHVRISAGILIRQRIPLYIVPSAKALRPRACGRGGLCEPKVARPPAHGPYVRVATVSFRRRLRWIVSFRVPPVAAGRYELAYYCGPCYRGPGGSLIADRESPFTVARP